MRTAEFSRSHFAIICLARRVVLSHRPVHQQAVYRVFVSSWAVYINSRVNIT